MYTCTRVPSLINPPVRPRSNFSGDGDDDRHVGKNETGPSTSTSTPPPARPPVIYRTDSQYKWPRPAISTLSLSLPLSTK